MRLEWSRNRRRGGWVLLVLGSVVLGLGIETTAGASSAPAGGDELGAGEWVQPVSGPVVDGYREPLGVYGPGHRGVDLAAPVGTPVQAANDGAVVFAGDVAGALHVVVAHEGGIRTSYSFLLRIDVAVGEPVRRGRALGAAGGSGEGHEPGVLHFGARVGDRYVDPMLLYRPRDLTKIVRLVPSEERFPTARPTPEEEAGALYRSLINGADQGCGSGIPVLGGALSALCDAAGAALDAGLAVVSAAGAAGAALARRIARPMHELLEAIAPLTEAARRYVLELTPAGKVLSDLLAVGGRVLEQLARECDPGAAPANGQGGSGAVALAVGGIDSHRDRALDDRGAPTTSFGFRSAALGYQPGDVHYFSYRDGVETYGAHDTHQSIVTSAALLADQLRAWARAHPGRRFDLVGHSQGGVVILAFLAFFYQGHESEYPPIQNVLTFASPLAGAPLATADVALRRVLLLRLALDVAGALNPWSPPEPNAPAVLDLAETSSLMRAVREFHVPEGIHWTSITGTADFVVPAQQGHVEGASEISVTVGNGLSPFDDHSGILRDEDALAAARAGLEHRPLPCQSIGTTIMGSIAPIAFARISHAAGDLGWLG